MLLPDVNVLIHAHNERAVHHQVARAWWEQTLTLPRPVGLSWMSILGFLRIVTRPGVLVIPLPPEEALRRVRGWLSAPGAQIVTPGEKHAEILFGLIESVGVAGNLTTDAHLAALAIEYQAEVASTDTDFARFPGVRWFNPARPGYKLR
jgi:toxin-antitoxin system PIN domain toxin